MEQIEPTTVSKSPQYPTEKLLWIVLSLLFIIFITLVSRQAVLTYQPRAQLQQGDLNVTTSPPNITNPPGVTNPPVVTNPPGGCPAKQLGCKTRLIGIHRKQCCHVCTFQLADCSTTKKQTCAPCTGVCK